MSQSKQIEQLGITSTSDIVTLLQYQDKLLNLVHSTLYTQQVVDDDAVVKFQINYVTEMNQAWKRMIDDLLFRLVRQRLPYQSVLRDHFHKVLSVDYLPFLRINRHQLTQVSLFGFDIYVQPLSAILQILNRIDGQKHILTTHKNANNNNKWQQKPRDIWQSIKQGWNQFIYESTLTKISLNIYMLKQYLKIAAKSLVRKDKQIIFTGCTNLFAKIVPALKQNKQVWLLVEVSELNNQLYQFHPNFNYSYFLSLLLPVQSQLQPVFRPIKIIAEKSLHASILTPLLFSLLRNRVSFLQFIDQADHECWAVYLNGLVYGLICNFKTRILEYEQIMQILQKAIFKLGVLNKLQTSYFVGQLGKQWAQTRDFFISALKTGYNIGELQTWHPTDYQTIQQRLIKFTKNSLLMHTQFPPNTAINLYFPNPNNFDQQLQSCLQQLTGSLLNKNQLINNFSPNISQAIQITNSHTYQLLKLAHLLKLCKLSDNINCICYVLSFINRTYDIKSSVLQNRLISYGNIYCLAAIKQLEKNQKGREDLKQVLFTYIKRNTNFHTIQDIVRIFLIVSNPKQAISQILAIVQQQAEHNKNEICKIVAANVVAMYSPDRLGAFTRVKTFDKQYLIQSQVVNLNSKFNSCLSILIDSLIFHNSSVSKQIILWMLRYCKWLAIPLLSFPVSFRYDHNQSNNKLQSFSIWIISNPTYYQFLTQILSIGLSITNAQLKKYFVQICISTINDLIIMQINTILNQLNQIQDNMKYLHIIKLIQIFISVYRESLNNQANTNVPLLRKIMKLYLRALEKLDTVVLHGQDQDIIAIVIRSLFEIYCPLLDFIIGDKGSSRKWRANMRKICLNSLDINVQHVVNIRQFQLPSIRKDKGFVIHNPVQPSKQPNPTTNTRNIQKIKKQAQQFYKQSQKYLVQGYFLPTQQQYLNQQFLLTASDVINLKQQEPDSILCSKQYLLPVLSQKMVKMLISMYNNIQMTIADLLALTPSNHSKLTQYAITTKNKQILIHIGLSKQTAQNWIPQICNLLSAEQISAMTQNLDKNTKQNISDNFNLLLIKQKNYTQITKQRQMVIDFSRSLAFLVVLNQSNWRYMNQIMNDIAVSKMNGLNSIPSVLLQFLQYVKITLKPNQDYQQKLKSYLEIVQAYQNLLTQKHNHIISLQKQSQPKQKQQKITNQQLHLFKINQLAYIGSICEVYNFKDFLSRAAYFRSQISNLSLELGQFANIFVIIDEIQQLLFNVNRVVNYMAGGNVMAADFLYSYCLCSDVAFQNYKISLGESLQGYQKVMKRQVNRQDYYLPAGKQSSIADYINLYLSNLTNIPQPQHKIKPSINNIQQQTVKKIADKYNQLQQLLIQNKVLALSQQSSILELVASSQQIPDEKQKQFNKLLYFYGVLYSAMEQTKQKLPKISKLVQILRERKVLSWQLLKNYDAEAYHHIKATLIDEQIQSRKIKFVYHEKLLIPQGVNIQVNKLNRQKYCNLIAKISIGQRLLARASAVMKGIYSLL